MAAAQAPPPYSSNNAPVVRDEDRVVSMFVTPLTWPNIIRVTQDPPIYVVPNFLNEVECTGLAAAAQPNLHRSIVVDGVAGKSPAPSRTSESCYLTKESTTWLAQRVAALVGKPASTQEPPQVTRYLCGNYYLAHYDAFDVTTEPGRECLNAGGQRVATVLIYLNSVASGTEYARA